MTRAIKLDCTQWYDSKLSPSSHKNSICWCNPPPCHAEKCVSHIVPIAPIKLKWKQITLCLLCIPKALELFNTVLHVRDTAPTTNAERRACHEGNLPCLHVHTICAPTPETYRSSHSCESRDAKVHQILFTSSDSPTAGPTTSQDSAELFTLITTKTPNNQTNKQFPADFANIDLRCHKSQRHENRVTQTE